MYPNRDEEYDRIRKLVISIILDYNITIDDYPLDMEKLCKKMQINVVPYSAYTDKPNFDILIKKSKDGFNISRNSKQNATIYYNDRYGDHLTPARISQTIAHELKHILEEDKNDADESLCDNFAKYLRCPIPIVIYLNICTRQELISKFGVSDEQAGYILEQARRHKNKFQNKYFDYEVLLIKQILGKEIEINEDLIVSSNIDTKGIFNDLLEYNKI